MLSQDERRAPHLIAYVDGGSRGNPGPAGIGVVVAHPTGKRVEISQSIGARDNNYAEYAALVVALEYASACDSPRLQVYSDSEVVVRQISGSYNCQSPALRDIYSACMALIGNFQHFAITHIRRENNADADRLAREAIDRATREKQPARNHPSASRFLDGLMIHVTEQEAGPPGLVHLEQPG
jgi:ribonuclease HI